MADTVDSAHGGGYVKDMVKDLAAAEKAEHGSGYSGGAGGAGGAHRGRGWMSGRFVALKDAMPGLQR